MRRPFNFRLSDAGRDWVEGRAEEHHVTLADVFRACMTVAIRASADVDAELQRMKESA